MSDDVMHMETMMYYSSIRDEEEYITYWKQGLAKTPEWLFDSELLKIAALAHQIKELYPDSRLVSLGQSPAWIFKAVELEAALLDEDVQVSYLPFSTTLLSVKNDERWAYEPARWLDFDEASRKLRKHLDLAGLSPNAIIDRHEQTGVSTTIVELAQRGQAMASIVYTLFSWAKEEGEACEASLRRALNLHACVIEQPPCEPFPIAFKFDGIDPVPCRFQECDMGLMYKLQFCEPEARIVYHCPVEAWGEAARPIEGDKEILRLTLCRLTKAVASSREMALRPDASVSAALERFDC